MLSGAYLQGPQHGLIERACARGPPAPCASRSSGPPSSYGRRGPPARDEQEPRRRDWGEERERERDWGREQDRGARRPFSEQQQQQLLQRQREGPPRGQREWGGEEAAGSWRDGPRGYNERGSAGGGRGGGGRGKREEAARKAARLADKAAEAQRRSQGCCYGCGATLQTEVPGGPGYVAPAKYQVKKQRKQLDKVLCGRCSELCNGAMIPAVQDFTQKLQLRLEQQQQEQVTASGAKEQAVSGAAVASAAVAAPPDVSAQGAAEVPGEALSLLGKALVTPEQLRAQLTQLSLRAAVVVLLVDLLDASGTLMGRVRDMVGRNPIVLVGTKMDLLPEGTRPRDVAEWLSGAAASKRLNVVSVHLVSAHTGEGMSAAVARICRERKSRDVFVVGAANVGKSAFVRAMLKELARTEPVAIGTGRYLPVESAMPGTTLGLIPLQAFSAGGTLYDTPGVHLHHRIPHMLAPHELKLLHPRRRLAVMVPPPPADLSYDNDDEYDSDDEDAQYGSDDDDEPGIDAWDDLEVDEREGKGQKGAVGGGEQAGERLGRGGLRIVTHDPVDDYGMPMTGLDAGIRKVQPAGRGGKAAPAAASAAAGGASGSGKQVQAQGQQQRVLAREAKAQARGQGRAVRGTYMWSDLVRVDVLSGPPSTALVFYGPPATRVVGLPYIPPSQKLEVDYTGDSESPSGSSSSSSTNVLVATQSVAARGGLQAHDLVVRASGAGGGGGGGAVADVAVSGLPGWVAVWAPRAKTDVRLRVWAPRGVEVMLRTPLPLPPPPALLRAWRGETAAAGGGAAADDETPAALDEWAGALAQSVNDPTSDPSWWEAMAALKEEDLRPDLLSTSGIRTTTTTTSARKGAKAAPARPGLRGAAGAAAAGVGATAAAAAGAAMGAKGSKRQEQQEKEDNAWGDGEEDLPDWDDEEEMDGDGDDGRTVVVSATVEDILRRPRLDVLSQMDLEEEWDALEDEDEDLDGWGDGGEEDGEEGPRKRGQGGAGKGASGPARDGAWDPLAFGGGDLLAEGGAVAAAAAAGASRRRGAAGSSSSSKGRRARADVEEVEAEVEVEEEDDEEVRRPVLRRVAGGVRRRALGRRRAVVVQQVKEEGGEGDQ